MLSSSYLQKTSNLQKLATILLKSLQGEQICFLLRQIFDKVSNFLCLMLLLVKR